MGNFQGYPEAGIQFLHDLRENNNKDWWEANKRIYVEYIREPSLALITDVGEMLREFVPDIYFDTRVNGSGSLMRPYRDTRFSEDKTPYKVNVAMMWWEGSGKKTEHPAYGFQLSLEGSGLMAGIHNFSKDWLEMYRDAILNDKLGDELEKIISEFDELEDYSVGGLHYKRVPRGYDSDHPRAELLKYNALYVHHVDISLDRIQSPDFVNYMVDHFRQMAPIQRWLMKVQQTP